MKILHWDELFHPTFGYQINILAKMQAEQGHEVIIMTSEKIEEHRMFSSFVNDDDISKEDEIYSKKYNVKIIRLPIITYYSSRVIFKPGYIQKIIDEKPDVIFCHFNDTLASIRIAQKHKKINIPIVFDNHMLEMAANNPLREVFRWYFRTFITPIIKKNNWTVIKTQDDDYVNKHLGIPEEQTPFISFGSDTSIFFYDESLKLRYQKEFGIDPKDFVIVYTGKLDDQKGGKLLAEAFEKKISGMKNVTLVVVGNTGGEYGDDVEKRFAGSENTILRFPTQRYTDLPKFYQAADLCVFAKQASLSFYDAQACGLPVVSEDNNVNYDRVQHDNGVNFKSGSVEDFRLQIKKMVEMPDADFKRMSENAIKFIGAEYDYRTISQEYTDILVREMENYTK